MRRDHNKSLNLVELPRRFRQLLIDFKLQLWIETYFQDSFL